MSGLVSLMVGEQVLEKVNATQKKPQGTTHE